MTDNQKKAIAAANKAFKNLHKAGILICGMDDDLLYATIEACEAQPDNRQRRTGDYCEVANTFRNGAEKLGFDPEDSGRLYSDGYLDSGGW